MSVVTADDVRAGHRSRTRRRTVVAGVLAVAVVVVAVVALMVGNTFYPLEDVLRVVAGEQVRGASFTVGQLRLPRMLIGLAAGFGFGLAGVTFQTMLRNPLASPDILGISLGASVAAAFGIIILSWSDTAVALLALAGALVTAAVIYLLATGSGSTGTRLILIGIGVAALLRSALSYLLKHASEWDLPAAMQWLSGSLNSARWSAVVPTLVPIAVLTVALFAQQARLDMMRLGEDTAAALGVRVGRSRLLLMLTATALLAFATAGAGPVSFVAFMAGPIAGRLVRRGAPVLLSAGLVGALLVLVGDLIGQFALGTRYPVGIVTGALGAPYLLLLLLRANRSGGTA